MEKADFWYVRKNYGGGYFFGRWGRGERDRMRGEMGFIEIVIGGAMAVALGNAIWWMMLEWGTRVRVGIDDGGRDDGGRDDGGLVKDSVGGYIGRAGRRDATGRLVVIRAQGERLVDGEEE